MTDLFEKCRKFTIARQLIESGIYPYFKALESEQAPEVMIEGKKFIMFGSNNYLGLANDPPPDVVQTLIGTAHGLEMVRALLQAPILISSGYRSPKVNRAVGGSPNSQHITGHAVDLAAVVGVEVRWTGPSTTALPASCSGLPTSSGCSSSGAAGGPG